MEYEGLPSVEKEADRVVVTVCNRPTIFRLGLPQSHSSVSLHFFVLEVSREGMQAHCQAHCH